MNLKLLLTLYTKSNSKWIRGLHVKYNAATLLQKNTSENLQVLGLGEAFLVLMVLTTKA